ncbi:MAG: PfkB family carbohydrate kinase [Pseudomonadota bacterium]
MHDIIVGGSLHMDIVVHAPRLPALDETLPGDRWEQRHGGKGRNQAVIASRFETSTGIIGAVGNDDFGRSLCFQLEQVGVDINALQTDSVAATGMSSAIIDGSGDYGAVIVPGATNSNRENDMAARWASLGGSRLLLLQSEWPLACNLALAKAAKNDGATVIWNAAPFRKGEAEALLPLCNVLVINRVEAAALAGLDMFDAAAALDTLRRDGLIVVITCGADGVHWVSDQGEDHMAGMPVQVADTHGAGDCFVGVLACELARGAGLVEALRCANQAAGAWVSLGQSRRHLLNREYLPERLTNEA